MTFLESAPGMMPQTSDTHHWNSLPLVTSSYAHLPSLPSLPLPLPLPLPPLLWEPALPPVSSSSVSSPSAPDPDPDCSAKDVDDLLEGIDRARIDDLWITPRSSRQLPATHAHHVPPHHDHHALGYAAVFAPPQKRAFCALPVPTSTAPLSSSSASSASSSSSDGPISLATAVAAAAAAAAAAAVPSVPNEVDSGDGGGMDEMPHLFKTLPCPTRRACEVTGDVAECFYYHDATMDRRRKNTTLYKPHMCRFIDESAGCRKQDRCPFSHNDFERRYHPDRFGKETCRDFLRGDCPRRFCTFRHHVSRKVAVALEQVDGMGDKEMLQLVLKISDERGRQLCDKLLRRFGHGKKHSGWRVDGFSPARDDAVVRALGARVERVKRQLKEAGEKKWAASLKTCGLRDMMSGVRKVAEEMRERCRGDGGYVENGGSTVHCLIRGVFSNTNWSCHSQEGDNPFVVTVDNQNDAVSCLERLLDALAVGGVGGGGGMVE